jgi:hypothetical protein
MRRLFRVLLLCLLPGLAAAMPKLDLQVRLDPASREFTASAAIDAPQGIAGFLLGETFTVTALAADGRPAPIAATRQAAGIWYRVPAGTRRVQVDYRATLKPLAALDHRQALSDRSAVASPDGGFLPSASGWHPALAGHFTYRVALDLPPGQKGLVPGDLVRETDAAPGYRAEFDFPHPADGIDLMTGPYVMRERAMQTPGGRTIRLRTWFHAELAALADGYLADAARYIERYSRLIGDYPFGMFSIVASPTPTGFGMPSLTYLGREVLRLPFIRATSLGHEILHNWWGNGVYPDWRRGNWSEGLTTFLADYAYKEDAGDAAARAMRLGWLRNLAAVPPGADAALKEFTARRHGISSIVGYDKAAMVFLMLRDTIGADAFARGLRLFWERHRFRTAGWSDLEAAFAQASGRSLREFFRQWVERPGAPALRLKTAALAGDTLEVGIAQAGGYALDIPLRLNFPDRSEVRRMPATGRETRLHIVDAAGVQSVELDPDYRLWRRVDAADLPAILREVFVAPRAALVVPADDADMLDAARALSGRVLDARPHMIDKGATGLPDGMPTLVVGRDAAVDDWLARHGLPPRPALAAGSAHVWAARSGAGVPYAVVAARDAAALTALRRPLPHYGGQSWLVFEAARATDKGTWPPRTMPLQVRPGAARPAASAAR